MSLPDTAFIFILALIIFGPKKLPEIGRQLGRLVGEFRRASNEFKFQIEEELRLAELSDKSKRSTSSNTEEPSISEPDSTAMALDSGTDSSENDSTGSDGTDSDDSTPPDMEYTTEEMLPVGQHPNMEYQKSIVEHRDSYDLNEFNEDQGPSESNLATGAPAGDDSTDTAPTIRPATGSQPRTTLPYSGTEPEMQSADDLPSAEPEAVPGPSLAHTASLEAAPPTEHEPVNRETASPVVDVAHG